MLKVGITAENAADLLALAFRNDDHEFASSATEFADNNREKTRLLIADPIAYLVRNDVDKYEKILKMMKKKWERLSLENVRGVGVSMNCLFIVSVVRK